MYRLPRYRASEILDREGNNLDLVRLICAGLVIYGHAFVILPVPGEFHLRWDPSLRLGYPGVYAASIAVKVFFFISGLLVTNSLLARRSVSQFVLSRFFRIWPALTVVVLAGAFVIGPLFTAVDAADYFRSHAVYHHVFGHLLMQSPGNLPGVFLDNHLPSLVNGALWSLSYEIAACLGLLIAALIGVLRRPAWAALLLLAIIADPLVHRWSLFPWIGSNPQFVYLPPCFALGAFLAVLQHRITLGPVTLLGLAGAFALLRNTAVGSLAFFVALFGVVLYLSALPWFRRARLPADLSYGTFLWGFPVQQILAATFPSAAFSTQLFAALGVSLLLAGVSWHLIEKPALAFGRRLARRAGGENGVSPGDLAGWSRPLGPGARVMLALIFAALPVACVFASRAWGDLAARLDNPPHRLSPLQARALGIEPPATVSFVTADLRPVGGRQVLMLLPPSRLTWVLNDTSIRSVMLGFGFHPEVLTQGESDGAEIMLELEGKAQPRRVFSVHLNPGAHESDRDLQRATVPLPPFEAGARLSLFTSPGASGNQAWDWLYLAQFGFGRGGDYAAGLFPGFGRLPTRVTGDSSGTIASPDGTPAVFFGTPSVLEFRLRGGERSFRCDYGFFAGAYDHGGRSDGADFRVERVSAQGAHTTLAEVHLDPVAVEAHRQLQRTEVALPGSTAGETLVLSILPGGHGAWDQLYIQKLELR